MTVWFQPLYILLLFDQISGFNPLFCLNPYFAFRTLIFISTTPRYLAFSGDRRRALEANSWGGVNYNFSDIDALWPQWWIAGQHWRRGDVEKRSASIQKKSTGCSPKISGRMLNKLRTDLVAFNLGLFESDSSTCSSGCGWVAEHNGTRNTSLTIQLVVRYCSLCLIIKFSLSSISRISFLSGSIAFVWTDYMTLETMIDVVSATMILRIFLA
jgi:hypothetical protein